MTDLGILTSLSIVTNLAILTKLGIMTNLGIMSNVGRHRATRVMTRQQHCDRSNTTPDVLHPLYLHLQSSGQILRNCRKPFAV